MAKKNHLRQTCSRSFYNNYGVLKGNESQSMIVHFFITNKGLALETKN